MMETPESPGDPTGTRGGARFPLAPDDVVRRNEHILSARMDDEVVALHVGRGVCYGLDCVGARVWDLLDQATTIEHLCQRLTDEFAVDIDTCRIDVLDLLEDLTQEDLVAIQRAVGSGPKP
jgi:hypothetical protein